MPAFTTMEQAEERARELMATGAAIVAHVQRDFSGTISVRVLRPMSHAGESTADKTVDGINKSGAWDVLTEDDQT